MSMTMLNYRRLSVVETGYWNVIIPLSEVERSRNRILECDYSLSCLTFKVRAPLVSAPLNSVG
jgi:hypothetical protein